MLGSQRATFELLLADTTKRSRTIGDYRVELEAVAPYPFLSLPAIEPDDYRISLIVSAS